MKAKEARYMGRVAELGCILIDPEDEHLLNRPLWADPAGYICCLDGGKKTRLHRLIANPPPGLVVDHINRNKRDNRRANLRVCTHAENMRNCKRRIDNKSGFAGVWFETTRSLWSAQIAVDGKRINLGRFDSLDLAVGARLKAEEMYWAVRPWREVVSQQEIA